MREKRKKRIYLLSLLLLSVFVICFVGAMGFLNYRIRALELEEHVIGRLEGNLVTDLETATGFGKDFENYYGMEEVFASFSSHIPGPEPFVTGAEGELLYAPAEPEDAGERIAGFLGSGDFERAFSALDREEGGTVKTGGLCCVLTPIHGGEEILGYFGCLYPETVFDGTFHELRHNLFMLICVISLITCIVLFLYNRFWAEKPGRWSALFDSRAVSLAILTASLLTMSLLSIALFQQDYREKIESAIRTSLESLQATVRDVSAQGIDLRDIPDLRDYIEEKVASMESLRSVRISEVITDVVRTDEESELITFAFGEDEKGQSVLNLEAEISEEAIRKEVRGSLLMLISTLIILLVFVLEMFNLLDLIAERISAGKPESVSVPERQIGTALRFTGFLCSTAEYVCIPYAAMMIRESGESLFGLSVGMTAALPLTLEGAAQMFAMLLLPRFVKKYNIRVTLLLSGILMIACNTAAFALGGALVIVICRALSGVAYAGFKQISNFLITRGYETEEGRSRNISQDNAGLLAGATCGAGLGAILSANTGYATTFLFSAIFFVVYIVVTFFVIPWRAMAAKTAKTAEERPVKAGNVLKMIFSPEMLAFIVLIGIPLNIGIMLCVTLIPAICQTRGISSVMLSYCYIANGLAGIYLGPSLVAAAKKRFGTQLSIAFTFALTAFGIFILHVPPVMVMIVITSMILGFLDGFGTPLTTDLFMSLEVVKNAVDESTALIFSVVLSYVILTFAPVIAELMLLPGKGFFTPMMTGAAAYAAAAVLVLLIREKRTADIQV